MRMQPFLVELRIHIRQASVLNSENGNEDVRIWEDLQRGITLPFPPTKGMKIQLSPVDEGSPLASAFRSAFERTDYLVTGIFRVESTTYHVENRQFLVDSEPEFLDPDVEMEAVVDQYIYGYGFERDSI